MKLHVLAAATALMMIYVLQFLSARAGLQGHITPIGLTVLRFYVAGALFLPYILTHGAWARLRKLGVGKILSLSLLAGFPYLMVINTGIASTSAGYAASVGPGSIVLFSFLLPMILLKQCPDPAATISTILIGLGISAFVCNTFLQTGLSPIGTALFVVQGLMFSLYGVLIRHWQISPILATAVVAWVSCLPSLIAQQGLPTGFNQAPLRELLFQSLTQGLLAGAAALYIYTWLVQQVGPQQASLVMPSVPIISTICGWLLLKETLSLLQLAGLTAMALGMAVPGLNALHIRRSMSMT